MVSFIKYYHIFSKVIVEIYSHQHCKRLLVASNSHKNLILSFSYSGGCNIILVWF